jgi:hypothetical protein
MWRRIRLGLALSLAAHAAAVVGVVGWTFFHATPSRVDIDIVGMRLEDLKDLPLGAPAAGEKPAAPRAVVHAPSATEKTGTLASRGDKRPERIGDDADDDKLEGTARATDLKQLGPAGARFTMLLRVDRLKGTPYAAPVDKLLMRMPDRRDLLDGTGLDLYEDFDALLISTPNLLDYTLTFLAARHHLGDGAIRAAIDRGAKATGRVVTWRTERHRPWGERKLRPSTLGAPTPPSHDERILVLPSTGLVVVTPPAYRALLLAPPAKATPDAGAAAPDGAAARADGGDGGASSPAPSWNALLRRIDAEDGLLPPTGVAMVTAVDVFKMGRGGPLVFMGTTIDLPGVLTAVLGIAEEPYLEVTAEFAEEAEARRLEGAWPVLQKKLRSNPYVVLGGLSPIIGRVEAHREGSTVKIRVTATQDESTRILQLVASALGG